MNGKDKNANRTKSRVIWLVILLLAVGYTICEPTLERWTGIALPSLPIWSADKDQVTQTDPTTEFENVEDGSTADGQSSSTSGEVGDGETRKVASGDPPTSAATKTKVSETDRVRPRSDDRVDPASVVEQPRATPAAKSRLAPTGPESTLGQLKDVGGGVLLSSAGLRYTRGSQEGHRLKHVLRHDNDIPDRPGRHGVFDGDSKELLRVLDEAYTKIKSRDPQVKVERDRDRTVYDVDMKRRIGFVGGQVGRSTNHPPVTRVRMVLEDDRVITAYPF